MKTACQRYGAPKYTHEPIGRSLKLVLAVVAAFAASMGDARAQQGWCESRQPQFLSFFAVFNPDADPLIARLFGNSLNTGLPREEAFFDFFDRNPAMGERLDIARSDIQINAIIPGPGGAGQITYNCEQRHDGVPIFFNCLSLTFSEDSGALLIVSFHDLARWSFGPSTPTLTVDEAVQVAREAVRGVFEKPQVVGVDVEGRVPPFLAYTAVPNGNHVLSWEVVIVESDPLLFQSRSVIVEDASAEVIYLATAHFDAGDFFVGTQFLRGDVHQDGRANVADVVGLIRLLLRGEGDFDCPSAADWNGDDRLNLTDVVHGLRYLFAAGPPPPHPFPRCGVISQGLSCFCYLPCL
jgi:hypothetical protein